MSCHVSTWIKLAYIESYNHPVLSFLTANYACPQLCVIIAPSEALNEWSPHHPHPCWQISTKMLTSTSLISDLMYQKSRGCGLQNCHPFLGVAIICVQNPRTCRDSGGEENKSLPQLLLRLLNDIDPNKYFSGYDLKNMVMLKMCSLDVKNLLLEVM